MYNNKYDNDRTGCITFQDNDLQYIYTDFEPYGASRVFPCFDQPNLKAKMRISLVTDPNWNAISNEPAMVTTKFEKEMFKTKIDFEHKGSKDLLEKFIEKAKLGETDQKMTMFDYT